MSSANPDRAVRLGFFWVRLIMTIGWAIYPILHFVDVVIGTGQAAGVVARLHPVRPHQPHHPVAHRLGRRRPGTVLSHAPHIRAASLTKGQDHDRR